MARFSGEGSGTTRDRRFRATPARRKRARLKGAVELLEGRTLLSYTFSLSGLTATATGDAASDVLTIDQSGGLLRHSVNGGAFSDDWDDSTIGPQTLAADAASTVKIGLGGDHEEIVLGTPASPASTLFALFQLESSATPNTSSLIIDDSGSSAANVYTIDSVGNQITAGGINVDETNTVAFQAGVTLEGGTAANTFNVLSTYAPGGPAVEEPFTIVDGGSGTVNVGDAGDLGGIEASLTILSTGGATTLNLNDPNGTGKTALLSVDNGADTGSVTGLSPGAIVFTPSRLAALNLDGSGAGNTFIIDGTPAGITTTLSAGTGDDTVNVLATSGDLIVNGQDGEDTVNLGNFNGVQDLQGPVTVSNDSGSTTLLVNDSGDTTGRTTSIGAETITGIAPALITYSDVSHLIVQAGEGADSVSITNPGVSADLVVDTCDGDDTIGLLATTQPVFIDGEEDSNTVILGDAGDISGIQAAVSVTDSSGTTELDLDDSSSTSGRSYLVTDADVLIPSLGVLISFGPGITALAIDAGLGDDSFDIHAPNANDLTAMTANTGDGSDTVNVLAVNGDLTVDVDTQSGSDDTTQVGDSGSLAAIQGTVHVSDSGGDGTLGIDDSASIDPTTFQIDASQLTGSSFQGTIGYGSGLTTLNLSAGSGGNAITVFGTLAGAITNVNTGSGANGIVVLATGGSLVLNDEGTDSVTIGDSGSLQSILGPVTLFGTAGKTGLVLDDTSDPTGRDMMLTSLPGFGVLDGLAPVHIAYETANLAGASIEAGTGSDTLTVDFSGGNPIPGGGMVYDGGDGDNTLNLQGGSFTSEHYEAFGPGEGGIALDDSTGIVFLNLLPINDVVPVIDFSFQAGPGTGVLNLVDGPVYAGNQTAQLNGGPDPAFELVNFANKTSVTIHGSSTSTDLTIDNPNPADGLESVTVQTGNRNDTLHLVATPAAVDLAIDLGDGDDVANVQATGIAAGTTAVVDGGPGFNSLVYDAGGAQFSIVAGTDPGEVIITSSLGGDVDARSFDRITITNPVPTPPVPGPVQTIDAVEGGLVDTVVATFTTSALGAKASDFLATIDWGDGTTSAGTIVQDDQVPSVFDVQGSHTYAQQGVYVVGISIRSTGSEGSTVVGGVPVTIVSPPSGPVITHASAQVANGALVVTALPIAGTQGIAIPSGPIATFLDLGGAHPVASYSATIQVLNAQNQVVLSVPAASITQNGNTNSYTVNAPSLTLADPGTYSVRVTVTDNDPPSPVSVTGISQAVIAQAPISGLAALGLPIVVPEAQPFTSPVASFTSTSPLATAADFTATITWGDGTPPSAGTITQGADGTFFVNGTHTYANDTLPGAPRITTVAIRSNGGATTSATSTATVLDAPLTSAPATVAAIEGTPFGGVVATFNDAGGQEAIGSYAIVINWGDGTASGGAVTTAGSTGPGLTYIVSGSHTYAQDGIYAVHVSITSSGGSTTVASGTAFVADSSIAVQAASITATARVALVNAAVATFTASGRSSGAAGNYNALIDWGDGTPRSQGTVVGAGAGFRVLGSHTYKTARAYTLGVSVSYQGGPASTAYGKATVRSATVRLTGHLEPPAGPSGVIRDNTPTFVGTATPGSTVVLTGINIRLSPTVRQLGRAIADSAGRWRITSVRLPNAFFGIVARAFTPGIPTPAVAILRPITVAASAPVATSLKAAAPTFGSVQAQAHDAALAAINARGLFRKRRHR